MSTRLVSSLHDRLPARLVTALLKVAMIGWWQGRTFLDDDQDLSDVADFTPAEPAPPVAGSVADGDAGSAPHSVAA